MRTLRRNVAILVSLAVVGSFALTTSAKPPSEAEMKFFLGEELTSELSVCGPEEFLNRFDSNKDGQVSKEEFTGPGRRFSALDQDGDGIISRKEIESRRRPGQRGGGAEPRPFEPPKAGPTPKASEQSGKPTKPGFILILTDDMGWTGLSAAI